MPERSAYETTATCDDWRCGECGVRRGEHSHAFRRREIEFVGMLRIHNEARWISEVVTGALQLCEHVFVLDDHSTDNTVAICESFGQRVTVFRSPFSGLDEARDKNWLYDRIIVACRPEWILCIDGDEVLEGPAAECIRKDIAARPHVDSWKLKIEFLWNSPQTVRADRIYGDFWRPSLFRPFHEDPSTPDSRTLLAEFRFKSTPFGRLKNGSRPNLHCSSVPQRRIHGAKLAHARLKHYGYMERAWRVAKLDYYTSIDWLNAAEDCYRHMCQGDSPLIEELPKINAMIADGTLSYTDVQSLLDVPAGASLVHAGPLRLEPWREGVPWQKSDWADRQND